MILAYSSLKLNIDTACMRYMYESNRIIYTTIYAKVH